MLVTILAPLLLVASSTAQQTDKVPVVSNETPLWTRGMEWRIGERPTIDIGTAEGAPEYELSAIRGVLRLKDGTIVVANQESELRFYDRGGKHVRTVGRKGDGPTDFFQISGLIHMRDGNIGVIDSHRALKFYSANGRFVRVQAFPSGMRSAPSIMFDDGSFIQGNFRQLRREATAPYTDSVALLRHTPEGAVDTIGRVPARTFAPRPGIEGGFVHFGPILMLAGRTSHWYAGFPERWELTQYNASGAPLRVIRRAWTPVQITTSERQAYRKAMVDGAEESGAAAAELRANLEKLYADESFAKTLPAFGRLHVDSSGNLWAQVPLRVGDTPTSTRFHATNNKTTEWSVFNASGRWLGQVTLPPNFWVFDIGADYILGLWRDEFDVEHVRLYTLIKPR